MPFVMLRPDRPGTFRRTIMTGKKGQTKVVKTFVRGVPVELTSAEVDLLRGDIGPALVPVEFDAKGRPRIITDAVVPDEVAVLKESAPNEPANAN